MAQESWTIARARQWTQSYLDSKGDGQARISAQWLLGHATGLGKMDLLLQSEREMTKDELAVLHEDVVRRAQGEPLQYISGTSPFRYLDIVVRPGALIPRPETEVLVSEVLKLLPQSKSTAYFSEKAEGFAQAAEAQASEELSKLIDEGILSAGQEGPMKAELTARIVQSCREAHPVSGEGQLLIADIGTGTGCIACSLASEHAQTHLLATDISADALELALENATRNGLLDRIEFFQGDLCEAIPPCYRGALDGIVSNPPYIPTGVLKAMPSEVTAYEPALALDGGPDGLDAYRAIMRQGREMLKDGGFVACELHEDCLDAAACIAGDLGYGGIRVVEDLAGRPRVIIAIKA